MKRSIVCENFLKANEVNCCSIIRDHDDGSFNKNGCDCCNGLANTTYDCHGFSPKNKKIVELGSICGECLCYFYNGDDSDVEERV